MELGRRLRRHNVVKPGHIIAIFCVALAACGGGAATETSSAPTSSTTIAPIDVALAELEEARSRWAANGLTTYSYQFADGSTPAAAPRDAVVWDGEEVDPGDQNPSVEELFEQIEAAIESGTLEDIVYHPELGIPTDVTISGGVASGWTIDDLEDDLPGDDVRLTEVERARQTWETNRPGSYSYVVSVLCGCPLEQSMETFVDGDRIVDWNAVFDPDQDERLSPTTIDELFDDIRDLVAAGEKGLEEDEFRFFGSARFDPVLGYPRWIGLEIVPNPGVSLESIGLPRRIIFVLSELGAGLDTAPTTLDASEKLAAARELWEGRWFGSYTYELTLHDVVEADFTGPYLVLVIGGEIESVTLDGEIFGPADVPHLTIADVFELAGEQIARGEVDVLYDAQLGYPVLVESGAPGQLLQIDAVASLR